MRTLKELETGFISGGLNCIDPETYKKMQNKAMNDGLLAGGILSSLVGAAAFGAASGFSTVAGVAIAGGAALAVAPYAVIWGYLNSSTWNLMYTS
ncbi:MAG: hypothetical protein JSS07_02765 [Proteobacteria bacterium]|nr:hypothetical protein [Pseudomonadota bacterium]